MASMPYDRTVEDLGNIVALEHVNVRIPDQALATAFYVVGLGFTRDPYLMVGLENMWINLGDQQFHLPTGDPQVVRGHVGLVVPDLEALEKRLARVAGRLAGTSFAHGREDGYAAVTCPWGNRLRCYAPGTFGDTTLGMAYVEFPVRPGAAEGIGRFYAEIMGARQTVKDGVARIRVGRGQELIFRETEEPTRPYDGYHIAIYIADFSTPHAALQRHGLISEESNQHQYRFERVVDPVTLEPLIVIEHEVRSAVHPMYRRPLVNRNPAQTQPAYAPGRDAFVPGMA